MTNKILRLVDYNDDLNSLRAHLENGESQYIEFKREFPAKVYALAKEIAAFATSNQGIIYLGITNNGEIIGLTVSKFCTPSR